MLARRSSLRAIGLILAGIVSACGTADGPVDTEPHASTSSAIIGGDASGSDQDFAVRVQGAAGAFCTGVIVSPTLVMTAQHCLTNSGAIAGNQTANNYTGCSLGTDAIPTSSLSVLVGAVQGSSSYTLAVSRIFLDVNNTDCTKDIAFVELATPATGVVTQRQMLLGSAVPVGTPVTEVGWGYVGNETDGYGVTQTRQTRSGTIIQSLTGGNVPIPDGTTAPLPPGYVVADIPSCAGDSGAPLLDANGILVSITRGGTGTKVTMVNNEPRTDCTDSVLVDSPLSGDLPFIQQAFQAEGLMPWRVGQTEPPRDIGGACQQSYDCNSNYCVLLGETGSGFCSRACTTDSDCSNGTVCSATGEAPDSGEAASVCLAPQPTASGRGCSVASGTSSGRRDGERGTALGLSVFLALASLCGRGRKGRTGGAS